LPPRSLLPPRWPRRRSRRRSRPTGLTARGDSKLYVAGGPTGFAFVNANGIAATPDGETLILVQSNTGKLFTVDPDTGATMLIDAPLVPNGDGILLVGPLLFVVQSQDNGPAAVRDQRALQLAADAGDDLRRGQGGLTQPRCTAQRLSSCRLESWSLRRTADTCASTVLAEIPSRWAISLYM
jgi:sugar lactone lactonase YvrE